MFFSLSPQSQNSCTSKTRKKKLPLPRILCGLHHLTDQTTVTLVTIWLGNIHRLVREPVNTTTGPQVTLCVCVCVCVCVCLCVCPLCAKPDNPWSCVFLSFACVCVCVCVCERLSPLLLFLSSSTEHVFSLRSIPLLLSYITALSQVTIQQRWC